MPLSSTTLASSGERNDVEHINSIMQSIIQLSNSSTMFQTDEETRQRDTLMTPIKQVDRCQEHDHQHDGNDDDDYLESDSLVEQQFLKNISNATASFSQRIINFQRLVHNLIQQKLIHEKSDRNAGSTLPQDEKYMNELLKFGELKGQIAILENACQDLESQVEDLAKDRDLAKESERKVRRGLYRVASGRMKISEVLKVNYAVCNISLKFMKDGCLIKNLIFSFIQAVEESSSLGVMDLDDLQRDLLSSTTKAAPEPTVSGDAQLGAQGVHPNENKPASSAIEIDGRTIGVEDVLEMKKRIDDLVVVNASREEKILEVGILSRRIWCFQKMFLYVYFHISFVTYLFD